MDLRRSHATAPLLLVAAVAVTAQFGCGDDPDGGFGSTDDDTGDDDTATDPPEWVPSGEPGLEWSPPVRLDSVRGSTPFLLIRGSAAAHVFYNDLDDETDGTLYVRDHDGNTGELTDPVSVIADASWPYAVELDSEVHLLAATRSGLYYLTGGAEARSFEVVDGVGNTDSYGCDGRTRDSRLFRSPSGDLLLGLGFVQHNAVLGCVNEARFSVLRQGEWTEPAHLTSGWPSGLASWPDDQLVYATSTAVFTSDDGGETFSENVDGDTTQQRVAGADSVQLADGTILLIRVYSWADVANLALARGDPATGQWTAAWVKLAWTERTIEDARIARWGDTIAVAWLESRTEEIIDSYRRLEGFSRISFDNGATWSEESRLSVSEPGEQLRELALALGEDRALAGYARIRADGSREMWMTEAGW